MWVRPNKYTVVGKVCASWTPWSRPSLSCSTITVVSLLSSLQPRSRPTQWLVLPTKSWWSPTGRRWSNCQTKTIRSILMLLEQLWTQSLLVILRKSSSLQWSIPSRVKISRTTSSLHEANRTLRATIATTLRRIRISFCLRSREKSSSNNSNPLVWQESKSCKMRRNSTRSHRLFYNITFRQELLPQLPRSTLVESTCSTTPLTRQPGTS